jgi:hypothetical protein
MSEERDSPLMRSATGRGAPPPRIREIPRGIIARGLGRR